MNRNQSLPSMPRRFIIKSLPGQKINGKPQQDSNFSQSTNLLSRITSNQKIIHREEVQHLPVIIQQDFRVNRRLKIQQQLIEQNIAQEQCFDCKQQQKPLISLPCRHYFHDACLKNLMNRQVNEQSAIIKCKCNQKIPQQICAKYLSPFQLYIYFQIQAQMLPKLNQNNQKWKRCNNYGCDFLFIEKPQVNSKGKQTKCPNCIEEVFGKTITYPQP